jgi:hypothetical protein
MSLSRHRLWLRPARQIGAILSFSVLLACSSDGGLEDDRGPTGPQSHVLQPINEDIVYSYREADSAVTQPTLLEIGYGSYESLGNKSVYPLELELDIPKDSETKVKIREFIATDGKEMKLFGYGLYNLPLALLGIDTDQRSDMVIKPTLGGIIYHTDMHVGDYAEALDFGPTQILLNGISNEDIADLFLKLEIFSLFNEAGIAAVRKAVIFANIETNGMPVTMTGVAAYSRALDVSDTAWGGQHFASGEYEYQAHEVNYSLELSVSVSDILRGSLIANGFPSGIVNRLIPAGLAPLSVGVDAKVQYVPGLGPIMRRFTVTNSTDENVPVFTTETVLQEVLEGDSDDDFWVDALDRFPDDNAQH